MTGGGRQSRIPGLEVDLRGGAGLAAAALSQFLRGRPQAPA